MSVNNYTFFGVVCTPIVRAGVDDKFVNGEHTFLTVHIEMFLQVARDYGISEAEKLKAHQIRFYYNGLRAELHKHTRA